MVRLITVVSCLIIHNNKVLMIQEGKDHIYGLWNLPGGRLENNERLADAVVREVAEETGYQITLSGLTGIYNFVSEADTQVIMFGFTGDVIGGDLKFDNEEIVNVKWLSPHEIAELRDDELRNGKLIRKIIKDVNNNCTISLDVIHDLI